ncbi:MAG: glycosyltransferase family A protein [Candidatus Paceibacterota bacterium]
MEKETKISVIIPTWNSERTLEATIISCLNQTLPPTEILVCDDGSTDDSKSIVENIKDSKVIWVPGPHTGTPGVPRNNGLSICIGDWIAFCDSDDTWMSDKLEKQIKSISTNLASCTNAFIKKDGEITKNKVSNWNKKYISFLNLLHTNNIICSSALIHKSIFKKIGGFTELVRHGAFADYIYWLRVSTLTNFYFVDEPLVVYHDHPEDSLRSNFKDGNLLKKETLTDFIYWAKNKKLNKVIIMAYLYRKFESIKKLIRDKIKAC